MKKTLILLTALFLLPLSTFSQTKKKKGTTINISTSVNYYPSIEPYTFFSSFNTSDSNIDLTFLTSNSGTFVIEEGESKTIDRANNNDFPSQLLGVGASVQIKKGDALFHEISLTKLSFTKSSRIVVYSFADSLGKITSFPRGYKQRAGAFGFRYELGKYFGKRRKAKFRFGLSGGIEPSFYFYKRTPAFTGEYPVRAKIFTIDIAVIPMASFKLAKKITMDFKIIPNMLLGDFGSIKENNPRVPIAQQGGEREYNLPEINVAFSLLLRYTIKEPKKRRGS